MIGLLSLAADDRPNIILIMVDDMGFSDIGCYGGEIQTPNIDALADNGVRFTQFYNNGRCYPTRASLMTGLTQHQTGLGGATNAPPGPTGDYGVYGYRGYINRNCLTLAEALKPAGYHTYMTGKWHLGYHAKQRWPLQRGFDKFYGILSGASSFFNPRPPRGLTYMNAQVKPEGANYYTTDAFTDYAIQFVEEQEDDAPFFLYLAYTAPHWPLHAMEEDIEQYRGQYLEGWDIIRERRWNRMVEMGLVDPKWGLSPRPRGDQEVDARPWAELTEAQKEELDYRMAVYAAMVHRVDVNIGKLVQSLKRLDKFDNTLILFLSDNGACAEMYDDLGSKSRDLINDPNYSGAVSYGTAWANVGNTPFRLFKVWQHEGGISTPLVAHWPSGIPESLNGGLISERGHVVDFMPTFLEMAGAEYPAQHEGKYIHPLEGQSLVEVFKTGKRNTRDWMFWEHVGHRAARYKEWKITYDKRYQTWELYNMEKDRTEMHNLAEQYPELTQDMIEAWEAWAHRSHVFPRGRRDFQVAR